MREILDYNKLLDAANQTPFWQYKHVVFRWVHHTNDDVKKILTGSSLQLEETTWS